MKPSLQPNTSPPGDPGETSSAVLSRIPSLAASKAQSLDPRYLLTLFLELFHMQPLVCVIHTVIFHLQK